MIHQMLALLEEALIPASLVFLTKVLSMLFFNVFLSFSWTIKEKAIFGTFPSIEYANFNHFLTANSYSNLVTLLVIFLGAGLVILRGHFFHPHHMHPRKLIKIFSSRLSFLLADTLRIYHQGAVWLFIFYTFSFFLIWQGVFGLSFLWFSLLSLVLTNLLTFFYLIDILREAELKRIKDREIRHSYFATGANPIDYK